MRLRCKSKRRESEIRMQEQEESVRLECKSKRREDKIRK